MLSPFRYPYRYLVVHCVITLALVAVLVAPHPATTSSPVPTDTLAITLITGQTVQLRDGIPLPTAGLVERRVGGDWYAEPVISAALPAFHLDPRFFDLSYLAAHGLDDASSHTIPVIAHFATAALASAAVGRSLTAGALHLTHAFGYLPAAAGHISRSGPFLSADSPSEGITALDLDASFHVVADPVGTLDVRPALPETLPLIGADVARRHGLTGNGIAVAVLSSGIDANHPDLRGRVQAARDFSTDRDGRDHLGLGTHAAGVIAGSGSASDGRYGGVAPQARLIDAKIIARDGTVRASVVMEAMEWAADQGARIEFLGVAGDPSDGTDPVSADLNAIATARGVLFVAAAGDNGPEGKVVSPAAADQALAVGAADKQRRLAPWSARGPRLRDGSVKPDIAAPGVDVIAARANPGKVPYEARTGTATAAAVTAGAAALVMQFRPQWPAATVRDALIGSARPLAGGLANIYDEGAGMIDLARLIELKVLIQPATVSFGVIHEDDAAVKTVRLFNLTDHPYTVDLDWQIQRVSGLGWASIKTVNSLVTLPPSGSARWTFILIGGGDGVFSSEIMATRDGETMARAIAGFTILS